MKKKQRWIQLSLISIGLFLFVITYLYYPRMHEDNFLKDQSITKNFEKNLSQEKSTAFESLEYKGIYDLNKPFKVKSERAYIFNEDPDIVHMQNMHVTLYLNDERIVNITSDKGRYNKVTYDCFFEQNVKATDGSTNIFAENMDLLAAKNFVIIYNNVNLDYATGYLLADKIDYDFETKNFKVSMFDDKAIKMKVIQ